MRNLYIAFWAECMKIRHSKILWITLVLFAFIPSMMGLMFFVQKYPELSAKLGMIGTKASMIRLGKADWSAFFELLSQTIAAIGLIGFGFVTSWIFGREYADRTVKDILALPIARFYIVIAKFFVILFWCILLTCVFFITGLIIGRIINLSGWSNEILFQQIFKFSFISFLTILLCTPVAFFASYGRGYMLPMGIVLLTMIIANFTGLVGLGPYFPWAIPGLFSVPAGTEGMQLGIASYFIVILTSTIGFFGTTGWWRIADQH